MTVEGGRRGPDGFDFQPAAPDCRRWAMGVRNKSLCVSVCVFVRASVLRRIAFFFLCRGSHRRGVVKFPRPAEFVVFGFCFP